MNKLVECVPNISEGRDHLIIKKIADSASLAGAFVLSVEPDPDYNRTVITFVAEPETVLKAAFALIESSYQHIDMSKHTGSHPRIGATDVTPFVPVSGVTMRDCADLARRLGEQVASKLKVPVYLYGEAAISPDRQELSDIRKGQYEGLREKLEDPNWKPDFGEPVFVPSFGAAVIGARPFLIAYNVNLSTNNKAIADDIAGKIRTSGRKVDGKRVPGSLEKVKAIGVVLEDRGIAQVSINLVDFQTTNMHKAFLEVNRFAEETGHRATGSEVVGLVPLAAILDAGRHFMPEISDERTLVNSAIRNLGLSELAPFDPDKKILEYLVAKVAAGTFSGSKSW